MATLDDGAESAALIDFFTAVPTRHLSYAARLPLGALTFTRCSFPPNPGVSLGSVQMTVAIHTSGPFEMEWRDPDRDRLRQQRVNTGEIHASPADLPIFHRWSPTLKALIIAFDDRFVARTFAEAFEADRDELPVIIGRADPTIERLGILCDREIAEGGAAGRLYAESLATALVVHLFRAYGAKARRPRPITGGLTPAQLRRVIDHIEAQLGDDLGLAQLAALAGMSTHHFGQAFKLSTGVPPHRYVVGRRVHRAKELLLGSDRSIAEIAIAVGFSSQSHMTLNFRKLFGSTPARYQRDVKGSVHHVAEVHDRSMTLLPVR
jgi:AraC family transcriptional regulator